MSQTATAAPEPDDQPSSELTAPIPGEWFAEVRQRAEEMKKSESSPVFELRHPERAARILWMLAQGVSKKRIGAEMKVERSVIRRMEWRHKDTLETKKREFSREFAMAAEAYKDLLLEKADQLFADPEQLKAISPDKLALAMAITTDKSMALAGMASTVVEFRKGASIDDAQKMISEARARIAEKTRESAVEAEIIEA